MLNLWIKFALQDENSTLNIYFLKYIIVIVTDISNNFFNLTTFIHTLIFGRGPINKGQGTERVLLWLITLSTQTHF
jgi:hypothetical protein